MDRQSNSSHNGFLPNQAYREHREYVNHQRVHHHQRDRQYRSMVPPEEARRSVLSPSAHEYMPPSQRPGASYFTEDAPVRRQSGNQNQNIFSNAVFLDDSEFNSNKKNAVDNQMDADAKKLFDARPSDDSMSTSSSNTMDSSSKSSSNNMFRSSQSNTSSSSGRASTRGMSESSSPTGPSATSSRNGEWKGGDAPLAEVAEVNDVVGVRKLLSHYVEYYDVELLSETDLPIETLDTIMHEGCAKCLGRDPHLVVRRNALVKGANDGSQPEPLELTLGPYVVLTCKTLQCKHLMHLSCLLNGMAMPQTPALHTYHNTSFFRAILMPHHQPPVPSERTIGRRFCVLELALTHTISNAQILRLAWPQNLATYLDARVNKEYLFLALEDAKTPTSPKSESSYPLPTSSSEDSTRGSQSSGGASSGGASSGASKASLPEKRLLFGVARGQLIFKCFDRNTMQTWHHVANYDVSQLLHASTASAIKLVMVDPQSRNVLSLGVNRIDPPPSLEQKDSWGPAQPCFGILYVKYEFSGDMQASAVPVPASDSASMVAHPRPKKPTRFNRQENHAQAPSSPSSWQGAKAVSASPAQTELHQSNSSSNKSDSSDGRETLAPNQQKGSNVSPSPSVSSSELQSSNRSVTSMRSTSQESAESLSSAASQRLEAARAQRDQDESSRSVSPSDSPRSSPSSRSESPIPEWAREDDMDDLNMERDTVRSPAHDLRSPPPPQFPPTNAPMLNLTREQLVGNVVNLAKTHNGSRFIQQKLEVRDPEMFDIFLKEMSENVPDLMVDNFGHFAIEKLIQYCNDEQNTTLLRKLSTSITAVACQKHGSFAVQALVDLLRTPDQLSLLVESVRKNVVKIITHSSGHFVILRMVQRLPYESTKFIDDAILNNSLQIGTDHHGLRVVKAVLTTRRPTELTRLFKQIARLTMKLVENQYGNYVIQSVLDVAPTAVRTNIKVKMEGKYMRLSKQKFSSNVVEKCLKQSSAHWRAIIVRELIAQPAVSDLLRDRYGNYVLQTALAVSTGQQVTEIMQSITPHLSSLRENVRSKWTKMLKKACSRV